MVLLTILTFLKYGAAGSEGVIHCAFIHDFTDYASSVKKDQPAIQTFGAAFEGTNRLFIISPGILSHSNNRLATERDQASLETSPRALAEEITVSFYSKDVRSSVIRLPPSVHDMGDHGSIPRIIAIARSLFFPSTARLKICVISRSLGRVGTDRVTIRKVNSVRYG